MKALLDSNIVRQRETGYVIPQNIGILYRWLNRGGYVKCVLESSIEGLNDIPDKMVNDVSDYEIINASVPMNENIMRLYGNSDVSGNGQERLLLLNEVLSGSVDLLITECRHTHEMAHNFGIQDRVLDIDAFLEKVFAEHPELVNYKVLNVQKIKFGKINLKDPFFDSLRRDYVGFNDWFIRKKEEEAYITINSQNGMLLSFLYLKIEDVNEDYSSITPAFSPKKRLKVGTFKVINNGFRLGERFLKIIFDNALKNNIDEIYVTVFDKNEDQKRLISMLKTWGFKYWGVKNGDEQVYVRNFIPKINVDNLRENYPYVSSMQDIYIVPIYEEYHTELFPDSILNTESPEEFVEDFPHRNGIGKVYVSGAMLPHPKKGDLLIFYRTGGYYKSVVTTIGVVEEVRYDFYDEDEFIRYCRKCSVYPEEKLRGMWRYQLSKSNKLFAVRFLYSYSFPHRINMKELIDLGVLEGINDAPRGFKSITKEHLNLIIKATKSDDCFIINQA